MKAFHVMSTAPTHTYYERPGSRNFQLEDFEILVTVLSALEWRRHNGSIKLYTDSIGAEHFAQLGLSSIWDAGIDTDTLEHCAVNTSFNVFWAYARTVALEGERCPCIMLDTDLIVWRNIDALICAKFMAIHSESLDFEVYVPKEQLHTPPGYVWDDWDWNVSPLNAALVYFGREDVREKCLHEGLRFLRGNFLAQEHGWPAHAVFVEQRLYPMCASKLGVHTEFFLRDYEGKRLSNGAVNDTFTHLWVYKRRLMRDVEERHRLCTRMAKRILRDFPSLGDTLAAIPCLNPYMKELSSGVSLTLPQSAVRL